MCTYQVNFRPLIKWKPEKKEEPLKSTFSLYSLFWLLTFAFQVSIKILPIAEREEILRQGLTDRNQAVQKIVEKELGEKLRTKIKALLI